MGTVGIVVCPEAELSHYRREGVGIDVHHVLKLVGDLLRGLEDSPGSGSVCRYPSFQISLEDVAVAGMGCGGVVLLSCLVLPDFFI